MMEGYNSSFLFDRNNDDEERRSAFDVFLKLREFGPFLKKRLKKIEKDSGWGRSEEVEDINFFLSVIKNVHGDELHGAETLQGFIDRIHEMIRKDPPPLDENDDDEEEEDEEEEENKDDDDGWSKKDFDANPSKMNEGMGFQSSGRRTTNEDMAWGNNSGWDEEPPQPHASAFRANPRPNRPYQPTYPASSASGFNPHQHNRFPENSNGRDRNSSTNWNQPTSYPQSYSQPRPHRDINPVPPPSPWRPPEAPSPSFDAYNPSVSPETSAFAPQSQPFRPPSAYPVPEDLSPDLIKEMFKMKAQQHFQRSFPSRGGGRGARGYFTSSSSYQNHQRGRGGGRGGYERERGSMGRSSFNENDSTSFDWEEDNEENNARQSQAKNEKPRSRLEIRKQLENQQKFLVPLGKNKKGGKNQEVVVVEAPPPPPPSGNGTPKKGRGKKKKDDDDGQDDDTDNTAATGRKTRSRSRAGSVASSSASSKQKGKKARRRIRSQTPSEEEEEADDDQGIEDISLLSFEEKFEQAKKMVTNEFIMNIIKRYQEQDPSITMIGSMETVKQQIIENLRQKLLNEDAGAAPSEFEWDETLSQLSSPKKGTAAVTAEKELPLSPKEKESPKKIPKAKKTTFTKRKGKKRKGAPSTISSVSKRSTRSTRSIASSAVSTDAEALSEFGWDWDTISPRRKRGRPRKEPVMDSDEDEEEVETFGIVGTGTGTNSAAGSQPEKNELSTNTSPEGGEKEAEGTTHLTATPSQSKKKVLKVKLTSATKIKKEVKEEPVEHDENDQNEEVDEPHTTFVYDNVEGMDFFKEEPAFTRDEEFEQEEDDDVMISEGVVSSLINQIVVGEEQEMIETSGNEDIDENEIGTQDIVKEDFEEKGDGSNIIKQGSKIGTEPADEEEEPIQDRKPKETEDEDPSNPQPTLFVPLLPFSYIKQEIKKEEELEVKPEPVKTELSQQEIQLKNIYGYSLYRDPDDDDE